MEKKPISKTMKSLQKGETADFQLHQASAVRSIMYQLSLPGTMKFQSFKNNYTQMIEVTRTI